MEYVPADVINTFVKEGGEYSHTDVWLDPDQYGVKVIFTKPGSGDENPVTLTLWAFNVKTTEE